MSLREFEIVFQMQYFKGKNLFSSKLVLLFGKNCSEEEISSCLMVLNLGRAGYDLY